MEELISSIYESQAVASISMTDFAASFAVSIVILAFAYRYLKRALRLRKICTSGKRHGIISC